MSGTWCGSRKAPLTAQLWAMQPSPCPRFTILICHSSGTHSPTHLCCRMPPAPQSHHVYRMRWKRRCCTMRS